MNSLFCCLSEQLKIEVTVHAGVKKNYGHSHHIWCVDMAVTVPGAKDKDIKPIGLVMHLSRTHKTAMLLIACASLSSSIQQDDWCLAWVHGIVSWIILLVLHPSFMHLKQLYYQSTTTADTTAYGPLYKAEHSSDRDDQLYRAQRQCQAAKKRQP